MEREPTRRHLPSQDPIVAIPLAGEALVSVVHRHARDNGYPFTSLIKHLLLGDYMQTRTPARAATSRVATFFGISPDQVRATTLSSLPARVVGTVDHNIKVRDPLGWATPRWSNRCVDCHAEEAPWELIHQTALEWVCERHNTYLISHYRTLFSKGDVWNWDGPKPSGSDVASPQDLQAQTRIRGLLERGDFEHLRNIRAASVLAAIDNASRLPQQIASDDIPDCDVTTSRDAPTPIWGRVNRSDPNTLTARDLHHKLQRPHPDPAMNGLHIRQALEHMDADGAVDPDWVHALWERTRFTRRMREDLAPYLAQLGLSADLAGASAPSPFTPRVELHPLAPGWRKIAKRWADTLDDEGWERDNLPGTLRTAEEGFRSRLIPSLARSVLIRQVAFHDSSTRAVRDCGGGADYWITTARRELSKTPSTEQTRSLDDALTRLLERPRRDQAELRRRQSTVRRVSDVVLRPLHLDGTDNPRISASDIAAVWLWTTVTDTDHRLAPFVDGRYIRPLIAELAHWQRNAPPEALDALLDWNQTHNLDEATPDRHITADPSASANTA